MSHSGFGRIRIVRFVSGCGPFDRYCKEMPQDRMSYIRFTKMILECMFVCVSVLKNVHACCVVCVCVAVIELFWLFWGLLRAFSLAFVNLFVALACV